MPPLDLPEASSLACLPGGGAAEHVRFHLGATWFPWRSQAAWFLGQMRRWGWLRPRIDLVQAAHSIYRPDLLAPAAAAEGLSWPIADNKPEGAHASAWTCPATPTPLAMPPDRFCDSSIFRQFGPQNDPN
jgi:hypothetical protein